MSQTSIVGLLGVSIHSRRAPSSCSPCASPAVGARRTVMPILAKYSCMRMRAAKKALVGSTAMSPGRRTAPKTEAQAAIPEAKTRALAR
jgi:hypothetical protein